MEPAEKRKCSGRRTNGEECRKPPMKGQRVCATHGGSSPQAKAAAERRIQTAKAAGAVETFGLPREVDPRDALLEEVYRSAGAVDWLTSKVRELQSEDVVWGKAEESADDVKYKAGVNVWVQLLSSERKHLVEVCKTAVAAGLEERRVRLAESQGAMLAGVIRQILGDLELSPEQQAKVPEVVPRHLRAIA